MEEGCNNMMQKIKTIVVIAILTVAFGFAESRDAEAGLMDLLNFSNIPSYPLLEKVKEEQMIINGQKAITIMYKADRDIDIYKVIDFYKRVLLEREWKIGMEFVRSNYGAASFTDDEMRVFVVNIATSPLIEGAYAKVFYIPGGTKSWLFKDNPEDNDMPGSDLNWLPRYPGAVRMQSMYDPKGYTTVEYLIPSYSCINCVEQFYKEHMLNHDWRLVGSNYQDHDQIQQAQANQASAMEKTMSMLQDQGLLDNYSLEQYKTAAKTAGQMSQPSEIFGLHFEKKGDVCAITISYKEAETKVNVAAERMQQMREEVAKLIEAGAPPPTVEGEPLEGYLSRLRPLYLQEQMNKQAVTVSIAYMAKKNMFSPSNRANFKMRRAQ